MTADSSSTPPARRAPSPLAIAWRVVSGAFVFVIVAWHLFFLAVRNPLNHWREPIKEWLEERFGQQWAARPAGGGYTPKEAFRLVDRATKRFASATGCEQQWVMFTPPIARHAPFLTLRMEFTDGSIVDVFSENEPDPTRFFRFGGWQTRKHEDYLLEGPGRHWPDEGPLWGAYVRHKVRDWQRRHPNDQSGLARVSLFKRWITFPGPTEPVGAYRLEEGGEIAAFTPAGELIP